MSYFLPDNYVPRLGAVQSENEARIADNWQDEVYRTAAELGPTHSVLDFGTGSGFKLRKYFGGNQAATIIGVDRESTVQVLKQKYPDGLWVTPDHAPKSAIQLVICADVIEHVDNPDTLMATLKGFRPQWLVISTPDRALLGEDVWLGPPRNPSHVREWTFTEFRSYLDSHFFEVVRHFYSNRAQATQCAVARLK